MLIGYARTSTLGQQAGLEAQERDLRAAGFGGEGQRSAHRAVWGR